MKRFAWLLIVAALAVHASHVQWLKTILPAPRTLQETLPSTEALRFLSLSYRSLAADYYWLRAIGDFGTPEMHPHNYPNLEPFLQRVLALDPFFVRAYLFAGTALTLKGMDARLADNLLRQGLEYRPEKWRIPFYLGCNLYVFEQNYAEAADVLSRAARLPEAPEFVGKLATRLAAQAGEPATGLRLVDEMLEQVTDERLRATYLERRQLLLLEIQLRELRRAAVRFVQMQGRPPADMRELAAAGLIAQVPADPLGGRYFVDKNGEVQTTSESSRLQLPPSPARSTP